MGGRRIIDVSCSTGQTNLNLYIITIEILFLFLEFIGQVILVVSNRFLCRKCFGNRILAGLKIFSESSENLSSISRDYFLGRQSSVAFLITFVRRITVVVWVAGVKISYDHNIPQHTKQTSNPKVIHNDEEYFESSRKIWPACNIGERKSSLGVFGEEKIFQPCCSVWLYYVRWHRPFWSACCFIPNARCCHQTIPLFVR